MYDGLSREELLQNVQIQIGECYAMIDHFIALNNAEEIAIWRRYLQSAKNTKRRLLSTST